MSTSLSLVPATQGTRAGRDRLELLTALIGAPRFDPLYRADVIEIPPQHSVFGWECQVDSCRCVQRQGLSFCTHHQKLWDVARPSGTSVAEFKQTATPVVAGRHEPALCQACPDRPAKGLEFQLCSCHLPLWKRYRQKHRDADYAEWLARQTPRPGYGKCKANCPDLAVSAVGLCTIHHRKYTLAGRPGRVTAARGAAAHHGAAERWTQVRADDEAAFRRWCASEPPIYRPGKVNLVGLQPLVRAEIQWGMFSHSQQASPTRWECSGLQHLANLCSAARVTSLFDLALAGAGRPDVSGHNDARVRMMIGEIVDGLRRVYYSPADTREAGFVETEHFGRRFKSSGSHFDLTGVSQRWLRQILWDHITEMLKSQECPRSRSPLDSLRRAACELSGFLEDEAPQGGHDPGLLREEHALLFVTDQRHRARHGLPSRGIFRSDGQQSTVTESTRRITFNGVRQLMRGAQESGAAETIGLDRRFITALPYGGTDPKRSRSPFTDAVARAVADESNLQRLAAVYDPNDRGMRDIWEAIVYTGRRCSEVLQLRLDCIGRYGGLAMLWHDQTKVDNYDEAIRIPEVLYQRLDERRATTLARFEFIHGRMPTAAERTGMALFPSNVRNNKANRSISYGRFNDAFRNWVNSLDLGPAVAHQARHTLATNLLRAGASITHIRKYLGQVSDRMAEHYTKVANSDLEDVLHAVWVAGPGSANPGQLLSADITPMSREQAMALALDLSRLSTPAEGGFCTDQLVVSGAICPWKLDCENCDKFVISGADLNYWRRKREHWRSIAERAPDDATADYLHKVFEPTALAIDGLEKALAAMGLLEQALTLDFRRPQDYFQRIWNTGFRPAQLAAVVETGPDDPALPAGESA
jgi:integrase